MSTTIKPVPLSPCPFCFSTKVEVFRPGMLLYAVQCLDCHTKGPDQYRKHEAVGAWARMLVTP